MAAMPNCSRMAASQSALDVMMSFSGPPLIMTRYLLDADVGGGVVGAAVGATVGAAVGDAVGAAVTSVHACALCGGLCSDDSK